MSGSPSPPAPPPSDLAGLPFPEQIAAIDRRVELTDGPGASDLLRQLATFPDHEPLAYAVRQLALGGRLSTPPLPTALQSVLAALPDTGVQRVLRGLERASLDDDATHVLAEVAERTLMALELSDLAKLCLLDRWLKNADRARRDRLRDAALASTRAALSGPPDALDALTDTTLARLPGAHLPALAALALTHHRAPAWHARLDRFAAQVLAILRAAPRSLSQANAEELLSRRVYTDPGHFLVELLQNAEDAGATAWSALIADTEVRVWHDGAPFDARDVVGVLSIGQTTKSRDQIGFFGVGFKSVYEICERPQVYSDLFAFEIADISIPRPLDRRPGGDHPPDGTLLVLPYRTPPPTEPAPTSPADLPVADQPAPRADVLHRRALAVPPETLLTLTNLRRLTITRAGPAPTSRTVLRHDAPDDPGDIRIELREAAETRRYRVASRRFTYDGPRRELHRSVATEALVAIRLDDAGHPRPLSPAAPTVFSHLPTGERSGLRVLVHAHFDVPVDRERLDLESAWNRWALARAGDLLADAAIALAPPTATPASLRALLDVLPLRDEVRDPAYFALIDATRAALLHHALLPGADGASLRPAGCRVLADPALLAPLAGVALDAAGRRPSATLTDRQARVAMELGALPFTAADLGDLLRRTLSATPDGAPWPVPWLAPALSALLDSLGRHLGDPGLGPLDDLPLLPSQLGLAHHPASLRRAAPSVRALYGTLRPFLTPDLDHHPSPGQSALLDHLGVRDHGAAEVVADLADPSLAPRLLAQAGPIELHTWLASLPPEVTMDLGALPIVLDDQGSLRPLVAGTAPVDPAWLVDPGALGDLLRSLPAGQRVPLVAAPLTAALTPWLRQLGARVLDLPALLVAVADGTITLTPPDLTRLHHTLAELAADLSPRQCAALAMARLFPTHAGDVRALQGPAPAWLPADRDVEQLAPSAPWLLRDLRPLAHITRMPADPVGARHVVAALVADAPSPLVDPADPDSLRSTYRYLVDHAAQVRAAGTEPLRAAPVWLDTLGHRLPLAQLQRPASDPELAELLGALDDRAAIETVGAPAAVEVVEALGLGADLPQADLAALVRALVGERGAQLARGAARALLVRALQRCARELDRSALSPLWGAACFATEAGDVMPPGAWTLPREEAAHRASGLLRAALSGGTRPLLSAADEADFGAVLDALGAPRAEVADLIRAAAEDDALATPAARASARAALAAHHTELIDAAVDDPELLPALAALPLWPTTDGRHLPASQVVRAAALQEALGDDWARLLGLDAGDPVLAPEAEATAAALQGVVAFRLPVELLAAAVVARARPGEPLSAQHPLLADRAQLLRLLAVLSASGSPELAHQLPLMVDLQGQLTSGRLWSVGADQLPLTRGLPLRARVADPEWAAGVTSIQPDLVAPLGTRHWLEELSAACRSAERPADVPALGDLLGTRALYRWLLTHRVTLEEDPHALATLGNARVIETATGRLRAPRELLGERDASGTAGDPLAAPESTAPDNAAPELAALELAALDLADWRAAADVPRELRVWLSRVFDLERGRRKQLTAILVAAHQQAVQARDGAASSRLLGVLASVWGLDRSVAGARQPPGHGPDGVAAHGPDAGTGPDRVAQARAPGVPSPAADSPAADSPGAGSPSRAVDDHALEWAVRNHKLKRLRVETDRGEGHFEQVSKLYAITDEERGLLRRFLVDGVEGVSRRYDAPPTLALLSRLGARRGLDAGQLARLLREGRGLLEGADATLALARYVAAAAARDTGLARGLDLARVAWIPDGTGRRREPSALYWPDPESKALLGAREDRFPHPELFHSLPLELLRQLPLRPLEQLPVAEVLDHLARHHAEGAPAATLEWLDQRLGAAVDAHLSASDLEAARRLFDTRRLLRDDRGVLRLAAELIVEPAPELLGTTRHAWSDGAAWPALAAALGVPRRVGPQLVLDGLRALAREVDHAGPVAALAREPGLVDRVPRCVAWLARQEAAPSADIVVLATPVAEGVGPQLRRATDPALALPAPSWLAEAARASGAPVELVILAPGAAAGSHAWLRRAGVTELRALLSADPAPAALPGDVTPAHATTARRWASAIAAARRAHPSVDALWPSGATQVRVVERLRVEGTLAGARVSAAPGAWFDRTSNRLVVEAAPGGLEGGTVAAALAEGLLGGRGEHAVWTRALEAALRGEDPGPLLSAVAAPAASGVSLPAGSAAGSSQSVERGTSASTHGPAEDSPREERSAGAGSGAAQAGGRGWWARVRSLLGGPDAGGGDERTPTGAAEDAGPAGLDAASARGEGGGGPDGGSASPLPGSDHSRFFDPRDAIDSQLRDGAAWLIDRTVAPEFGFSFAPSSLPFPHRYAPLSIAGRFEPRSQRWLPTAGLDPSWRAAAGGPTAAIAFHGRVPRGDNHFPMPLYGRIVELEGEGVRWVRGRGGRELLVASRPSEVRGRLELDLAPDFRGVERRALPSGPLGALLEPTVPDRELPDETLAFVEELRVAGDAPLDMAIAVRGFIQRRYRYDPSYLEDPAVARWLRRAAAGRPSVHLAALHAGHDGRHLGAGVCYELGVLACELLRRVGVPAAVSNGWTWEAGEVADPDHLWAMALLPTEEGARWLPIDPSTTRDGRPLRVGRRPPGGWGVEAPAQPRGRERETPGAEGLDPGLEQQQPARAARGRAGGSGGPGRQARGQRPSGQARPPRERKAQRPPIGELMRVIRHLSELSGQPLERDGLVRRCRELLDDPDAARQLLELLDLDPPNKGD